MADSVSPGRKGGSEALAAALASGLSVPAAARQAGLSERTVYRRLSDPKFRRRLAEARRLALERAVSRLTANVDKAVLVLVAKLKAKDPAVAVRAARTLLDQAFRGVNLVDVASEVEELKAQVDKLLKGKRP